MGRGLDGFFASYRPNAVFKVHGGRLADFRWRDSERETPLPIPNRAVKPLSADGTWWATARESRSPPVFIREPPRRGGSLVSSCELGRDPLRNPGAVVQRMWRARREARGTPLAIPNRLGLDAVLPEGREVDHQIGRVQQPLSYVDQLCHGREATGGVGRTPRICRGSCIR